jgi:DNA-binding PucR family transcriptional regulator
VEPLLGTSRILLGIGGPAQVSGLRGASEEAQHAVVAAANRPERVAVVGGEEIGIHRLLLAGAPDELRAALRRRVLGPLLTYDAEQNNDLVRTVRVFLECIDARDQCAAITSPTLSSRIDGGQPGLGYPPDHPSGRL